MDTSSMRNTLVSLSNFPMCEFACTFEVEESSSGTGTLNVQWYVAPNGSNVAAIPVEAQQLTL